MAIVAHTSYTGTTDCGRTNEYLCDGHGLPVDRTNRYISDGHGGHTICAGYNCPADPALATEYMHTLRANYERQHPMGEGRTKGAVTHEQIYVSPTEEDNVPPEERMVMMRELIERTPLRDFASIYCPHDNTPDKHGHISLCPYSIDGSHKLSLNNHLLYDLRREMDRICVEHGYSIVENHELWGDQEYREWFQAVKDAGIVKVHPPREQDMSTWKEDRKRARTYSASKEAQKTREQQQKAYIAEMGSERTEANAHLYTRVPHLSKANDPTQPLYIKRFDKDGRAHGEVEIAAGGLMVWAISASKEITRRQLVSAIETQKRLNALGEKSWDAVQLFKRLDIRTEAELIAHIKETGMDIAQLKQDVARQQTIIDRTAGNEAEAKRHDRAVKRLEKSQALLTERSTEYRHLKEAEATLRIANSNDIWDDYLSKAFSRDVRDRIGFADEESLVQTIHDMGSIAGLTEGQVDELIDSARRTGAKTTWVEYRAFMRVTFVKGGGGEVAELYTEMREAYDEINRLRSLADRIPVLGPMTLCLSMLVGIFAAFKSGMKEREVRELQQEAKRQAEHAKEIRREMKGYRECLQGALELYRSDVVNVNRQEVEAAKARYYAMTAEIVERIIGANAEPMKRVRDVPEFRPHREDPPAPEPVKGLDAIIANAQRIKDAQEAAGGPRRRGNGKDNKGIR